VLLGIDEDAMKYRGILVNEGFSKLDVFNEECSEIRDDCLFFLRLVKEYFERRGILFVQPDSLGKGEMVDFAIDFEIPRRRALNVKNRYLVRFECELIYPGSYIASRLAGYKKIFSWNNLAVNPGQFIKVNFPNKIVQVPTPSWGNRAKLCCMIASNKTVPHTSPLLLYSERAETIRWFEQHAPQDFDLFGSGWDTPLARHGLMWRLISKLQSRLPKLADQVFFPSYRGTVVSKIETLQKYRFSICYENVRDLPGYITEKIFDSFFAGCIPVYWGASNISTYIPEECFIDRRQFNDCGELYRFMVCMTNSEYTCYQERIATFLTSDRVKPFSAEAFADTVVNSIVGDLGIGA